MLPRVQEQLPPVAGIGEIFQLMRRYYRLLQEKQIQYVCYAAPKMIKYVLALSGWETADPALGLSFY